MKAKDTFQVHDVKDDGSIIGVRKKGSAKGQRGVLRVIQEGRPLPPGAEILQATYHPGADELELSEPENLVGGKGPAKFTTPAYRQNFDRVFNSKTAN